MLEIIKQRVCELLSNDNSGHGMDHIERVLNLSLKFADKEDADKYVVALIALLHDVDDHKLFGLKNSKELTNAKKIMSSCGVKEEIQHQVLEELKCIGYSKLLEGKRPKTIEGQIVSDADMCDGLGVTGVLRTYKYSIKKGKPFFDKDRFPIENMNADEYINSCAESSVCHLFEKILKLKNLMMTNSGRKEAENRHQIIVDILHHLFLEEDVPQWSEYLNKYLEKQEC